MSDRFDDRASCALQDRGGHFAPKTFDEITEGKFVKTLSLQRNTNPFQERRFTRGVTELSSYKVVS